MVEISDVELDTIHAVLRDAGPIEFDPSRPERLAEHLKPYEGDPERVVKICYALQQLNRLTIDLHCEPAKDGKTPNARFTVTAVG